MITLHENEKIFLEKRRHWYVIASESFVLLAAALIPLFVLAGLLTNAHMKAAVIQLLPLVIFAFSAWFLLIWIIFFVLWTNYYLDVLVVTNKRIIDIEQHGLFARDMVEIQLKNIQDVKVEVLGVLPSLLDFGNLHIQTAGQQREVVVNKIAHPEKVRRTISEQLHN